jgi:hypothetical protein
MHKKDLLFLKERGGQGIASKLSVPSRLVVLQSKALKGLLGFEVETSVVSYSKAFNSLHSRPLEASPFVPLK